MTTALDSLGLKPRHAGRRTGRSPLFDVAEQDQVRADLATFFGPRADVYLATYEKMRAAETGRCRTWSWPVFFGSFVWFFYRKMYAAGAIALFLPMLLRYLLGGLSTGALVVFAMSAKTWYVHAALGRIAKADQMRLTGDERADYLRRAGGVSLTAGLFAGFIYASMLLLLAALIVARRHHIGH